jgi:tetratricopeptide (TPR) repeat protein
MTVSDSPTPYRAVPRIWGNVPQRNKNFTGRTDILEQLRRDTAGKITAVLPGDPLPQALQGLGGVGKTAVVIEYAHRYRSNYDLVWWIPADQLPLVRASLAALAIQLGLDSALATGIEGAAAAALDALRRGEPYSRWLLIFDNADQPEDLEPLVPQGPGDVLITSRNPRWQSVAETVQMDVFTRQESTEFLTKRIPKGLSASDADRLAENLGDLPLAIEQAAALQAETGMPVDEYLRLLHEHTTKIMSEGKSPEYPLSMTAAWTLSVSRLRQNLPQALELLRCCAFFGPDPIPRDVFRRAARATDSRLAELMTDPILLASAIRELGRLALVKIDGPAISVHRLIQALLRDELDPSEQESYRQEAHSLLAASVPKDPTDIRLWPRYAELVAHVGSPVVDIAHCRVPEHRAFALTIVRYLYLSGDLASCRSFAERFIVQWAGDSGEDDPIVLDARRHLGNVLRELGDYAAAQEFNEVTLSRARIVLGEGDPLTLALRNSVGADLRARGDFAAARTLDEETLGLHGEEFGPVNPHTLRVMNNLALDHGLNSDYGKARDLQLRTFRLQSDAARTDISPTEVLSSWMGLARVIRLQGNYTEARDLAEDAQDYGRERLGAEHFVTLRAANEVSIALRNIALTHDEALDAAQAVFEAVIRILGEKHPDTLAAAISLSNIQRVTGRIDQALVLAESTVASYPSIYGPEHPYNYGCAGNLALLRRLSGNPAEARQINESALAGLDAKLGRDHHFSLTVAVNYASDLAVLGQPAEARMLGDNTLGRLRSLLGENHPTTLGCAANLAIDLRADEDNGTAESLLADTLSRYEATLGADHPDVLRAQAGERINFDFDPPPI